MLTRENFEEALDQGLLFFVLLRGNPQRARRNGKTKRWVRAPSRIYVPFKYGHNGYGQITEAHFSPYGTLLKEYFRHEKEL